VGGRLWTGVLCLHLGSYPLAHGGACFCVPRTVLRSSMKGFLFTRVGPCGFVGQGGTKAGARLHRRLHNDALPVSRIHAAALCNVWSPSNSLRARLVRYTSKLNFKTSGNEFMIKLARVRRHCNSRCCWSAPVWAQLTLPLCRFAATEDNSDSEDDLCELSKQTALQSRIETCSCVWICRFIRNRVHHLTFLIVDVG